MRDADRELAEKHWEYTEKVLLKRLELTHQLYVDAMVHGIKHGQEDKQGER